MNVLTRSYTCATERLVCVKTIWEVTIVNVGKGTTEMVGHVQVNGNFFLQLERNEANLVSFIGNNGVSGTASVSIGGIRKPIYKEHKYGNLNYSFPCKIELSILMSV